MLFRKNKYDDFIIRTLKEITSEKHIDKHTDLHTGLDIDSIAWVQILFKIENEFGPFRDIDSLISSPYQTVEDLINIIKNHYEN